MKTVLVYMLTMLDGSCPRFGQSTTLTHATGISYAHNTHDPGKKSQEKQT
jgi:hypothetical protein